MVGVRYHYEKLGATEALPGIDEVIQHLKETEGRALLPLSSKEHDALLRLLDGYLGQTYWQDDDKPTLRTIRDRLKGAKT